MSDFYDAEDSYREQQDIAHDHACHHEFSDETLDIAWLITAAVGVVVLHWILWWGGKA